MISVNQQLEKNAEYATNLLLRNSAYYDSKATWKIYTFMNNDLMNFVHYSEVPVFELKVMEASVIPEVMRFAASSFLHIAVRPLRDLGPFGQIIINAPDGYILFCRQKPFFDKGTLPRASECDGANTFAVVRLSGSDSLERGISYRFAIRVTNPDEAIYNHFHADKGTSSTNW